MGRLARGPLTRRRAPGGRGARVVCAARAGLLAALGVLVAAGPAPAAVSELERTWTVGSRAFADGFYDAALRELGRFLELAPSDPRRGDALLLRGKAAFALERYGDALAAFQAAESAPPGPGAAASPGEAQFWQAECLFRLKRYDEASQRYAAFLQAHPRAPYAEAALYGRAQTALELGRSEDALQSTSQLARDYPQSEWAATAAYTAARELVRLQRWDDAIGLLAGYPGRYPKSPHVAESRYLLGVAQIQSGRAGDGVRTLDQFLGAAPTHELAPSARALVAETYAKAGRSREALEHYQQLVRAAPSDPQAAPALYQIGELNQRLGRPAEAEAAWLELRRDFPRHALAAPAGLQAARLLQRRKQYDRAAEVARSVAETRGEGRIDALLVLGESALQLRRNDEAAQAYALVLAEAPAGSPARWSGVAGAGLADEARRDLDGARRAYREIVTGSPDPTLVRWAKERLQALDAPSPPPPKDPGKPKPGVTPKKKPGARP